MATRKVGRNDPCPCGSGKKFKNCCIGKPPRVRRILANAKLPAAMRPWGVPGEEHQLWVVPLRAGEKLPSRLVGTHGKYKVQLLLSRPGYPNSPEREHRFIDDIVGDSYVLIAKPAAERKADDVDRFFLQAVASGKKTDFVGIPNDRGFLGKLIADELFAENFRDAEGKAYEALAPFLSAWSLHLDIPVHVETIQVTDLQTHTSSLRVRTPQFQMTFAGGLTPLLTDDFCEYASLYREGLNSNSSFYRFLCFYKIIESIPLRRSRTNGAARQAGKPIRRFYEVVPSSTGELIALLKDLYPWRKQWDAFALDQMVPSEARGKKIGWVREKHLNPLRLGIAHALLKTGEVRVTLDKLDHIQRVNKWLPICRVLARLMLRNEFPDQFRLAMRPVLPDRMEGAGSP